VSWRTGGHVLHVGSSLGQLDGIPLEGVKAYLTGAKSVQEIIDMPYPAEDLAKVCDSVLSQTWQMLSYASMLRFSCFIGRTLRCLLSAMPSYLLGINSRPAFPNS
jgi:hypothetical protein